MSLASRRLAASPKATLRANFACIPGYLLILSRQQVVFNDLQGVKSICPRFARRVVEQQYEQHPRRQPQQEQRKRHEQQCGFSLLFVSLNTPCQSCSKGL